MPIVSEIDPTQYRQADHPIDSIFVKRWSPRAMAGEPISEQELMTLFEAARWAPSSYNEQPWRFLYARRDTKPWRTFFDLLVELNQSWTKNAAVLIVLIAKKTFTHNGEPNRVHIFDAGSAWENLALQAARMGLVAHGMAGFDEEKARRDLGVPEDFTVAAMIALGQPGRSEDLPEALRGREVPSSRKPVAEFVCEGKFRF
jgi:nitroreductase